MSTILPGWQLILQEQLRILQANRFDLGVSHFQGILPMPTQDNRKITELFQALNFISLKNCQIVSLPERVMLRSRFLFA